jgi:hypothetical protein
MLLDMCVLFCHVLGVSEWPGDESVATMRVCLHEGTRGSTETTGIPGTSKHPHSAFQCLFGSRPISPRPNDTLSLPIPISRLDTIDCVPQQRPSDSSRTTMQCGADRAAGNIVLGRYTIEYTLGSGSSGNTYAARDASSGDLVAVKELAIGRLTNWKQFDLFEREAKTLRGLSHPNIPNYLDYREDMGCWFLVQELADGPTLKQLMQSSSRLDDADVEEIARQLLSVLQYLSSRRCVPAACL